MPLQVCHPIADNEIVALVRSGETGMFELLMRRYNQRLFRAIRSIVSDELEAEDVLQDVWVRAYEHLNQFLGRASFSTWVTRIAIYEALGRNRKRKRWTSLEDTEGEIVPEANRRQAPDDTPEAQAMRGQLREMLKAAVDALPETYRSVFVLREVEQLSTSETADCLEVSEETVKIRLHRSRALLRRELESRIGPAVSELYMFLGPRCDRTVARVLERIAQ
ncbi:MAG TPA: RNA polymerase sigma factor [Bryobacteraceae bacterium]|jgi:RNA polymerase sigma-70 factor (ECF subfamily)|nr:RNA polymerase sigma factor [Bryobacteraceae bacterium]